MKLNKTQVITILIAVVVFVLLLFANTKLPLKPKLPEDIAVVQNHSISFDELVSNSKNTLTNDQKNVFDDCENLIKKKNLALLANKLNYWDSVQQPLIAVYFKQKMASFVGTDKAWEDVGNRFFALSNFLKDESRNLMLDKAIQAYTQALNKNANNTDVKISLASCFVERGESPMKGIGMLREIEKTDSNNIRLQLSFAFFSAKSAQWDKAILRYEKVLKLNPEYIEAYLHLADVYEQKGDKTNTVKNLEKYIEKTDDIELKEEVRGYINKLKTN